MEGESLHQKEKLLLRYGIVDCKIFKPVFGSQTVVS